MSYGLGVDLGTSFTRAAISRGGHPRMATIGEQSILMPSVVRVQPDGRLLAGEGALHANDNDPTTLGRDFKRRLGDPTPLIVGGQPHSAVSLMAATLRAVLDAVVTVEGEPPVQVMLTYPAVWGPYRREQFAEIPRQAGLDESVVAIFTEPEAAASHYVARQKTRVGDLIAVYDLGGGTFDTAVVKVTRTGTELLGLPEGVEWVGGIDFDEAVLAHVDRAMGGAISALDPAEPESGLALQRIRAECVRAKERLSRETAVNIAVMLPTRHTQVRLTRGEFEAMIRTPLESTLAALHRTLDSADVTPADLAGVLLIGGSSRIPLVSRMLTEDLGRPVLVDPHPQHCVALGAAAIAEGRPAVTAAARPIPPPPPVRSRRPLIMILGLALIVAVAVYGVQTLMAIVSPDSPDAPTTSQQAQLIADLVVAPSPGASPPTMPVTGTIQGPGAKCLDITNAVARDRTPVQLFGCNGTPAQNWRLGDDQTFRSLEKCLGTRPTPPSGTTIEVQDCNGGSGQKWRPQGHTIVNLASDLCLAAAGSTGADVVPLTLAACTTPDAASWTLSLPRPPVQTADSAARPRFASTISGPGDRPQGVAFSPDGRRAYVPHVVSNSLLIIDTATGRVLRSIDLPTAPQYVVAAADGRRIFVTLNDPSAQVNAVAVVDVLTGRLIRRIKVGRTLYTPAISPDGRELFVPDHAASRITVLSTEDYRVITTISVPAAPHGVAFSPDGSTAYVPDHETGVVSVLNARTHSQKRTFAVGVSPLAVATSPDGRQLAVANYDDRTVSLVDLSDNSVDAVTVGKNPLSVAYAPDGEHLYVANSGSASLSVVDVATQRVSATVEVGEEPWTVAVSPDGELAYVTNANGNSITVLTLPASGNG